MSIKHEYLNGLMERVIARTGPGRYTVTEVQSWVEEDDSLPEGER